MTLGAPGRSYVSDQIRRFTWGSSFWLEAFVNESWTNGSRLDLPTVYTRHKPLLARCLQPYSSFKEVFFS